MCWLFSYTGIDNSYCGTEACVIAHQWKWWGLTALTWDGLVTGVSKSGAAASQTDPINQLGHQLVCGEFCAVPGRSALFLQLAIFMQWASQ